MEKGVKNVDFGQSKAPEIREMAVSRSFFRYQE